MILGDAAPIPITQPQITLGFGISLVSCKTVPVNSRFEFFKHFARYPHFILCRSIVLRCRNMPMLYRFTEILFNANPLRIAKSQTVIRLDESPICRFAIPFHRLGIIFLHTPGKLIAQSQITLCAGKPLLC